MNDIKNSIVFFIIGIGFLLYAWLVSLKQTGAGISIISYFATPFFILLGLETLLYPANPEHGGESDKNAKRRFKIVIILTIVIGVLVASYVHFPDILSF
ncbi:hypothetical protein ACFLQN_01975 [Candidatus Aenigmatarchaeota archaeon]